MSDIRDILKGLDDTHRAVYLETRTAMRRAYLYAHSRVLPIENYNQDDDRFLDFIDIQIALLFDRAGTFNSAEGKLDIDKVEDIEEELTKAVESTATKMIKNGWTSGDGDKSK